jgi:small subunit ribosomal protein S14
VARKAMIAKWKKGKKYKVREYNRCRICGRPRGYIRKFEMCRLCFRDLARTGELPGVIKASW